MANSKAEGSPLGPASEASCSRTHSSAGSKLCRWICSEGRKQGFQGEVVEQLPLDLQIR